MGKILKTVIAGMMVVVLSCTLALPASAQVTLDDVLKRVEALEKENASLKAEVLTLKDKQSAQETKIAEVQVKPTVPAVPAAPAGNFLKTGMDISLYGFLKADAIFSSRDMGTSNLTVTQTNAQRPTATNGDDPQARITGQDTRLGLKLKAPDLDNGGKVTGQFEMDFGNSNTSQGNYTPRLRLAFAQLDFDKWGVNAGQNWDMFAPLGPNTITPGVLYRAGNLGTRHPQAHIINKWGEFFGGKVTTKLGIIDSEDTAQEDSGMPVAAAYAGYEKNILGVLSTFGVGGIYGRSNLVGKGTNNEGIYATTVGMTLKFTDWLAFKTEGFGGAGLNKFYGGPAQTYDRYTYSGTTGTASTVVDNPGKPIPVKGGFAELTLNPTKKLESNFGIGLDDVSKNLAYTTTEQAYVWDYNKTYYTNLKYSLSKDLLVGIEYQKFYTKWMDGARASDNRVESSICYKF
ncbi:MAG: hypothetical protein HQL22_07930 [Candidatus Omnitrophica bacterium]|nr:hypothetical protein [Candidatus Omnitrophota bacterium]